MQKPLATILPWECRAYKAWALIYDLSELILFPIHVACLC